MRKLVNSFLVCVLVGYVVGCKESQTGVCETHTFVYDYETFQTDSYQGMQFGYINAANEGGATIVFYAADPIRITDIRFNVANGNDTFFAGYIGMTFDPNIGDGSNYFDENTNYHGSWFPETEQRWTNYKLNRIMLSDAFSNEQKQLQIEITFCH